MNVEYRSKHDQKIRYPVKWLERLMPKAKTKNDLRMASYLRLVWAITGENIVIIDRKQLKRLFGLKSKCVTNSLNHLKKSRTY